MSILKYLLHEYNLFVLFKKGQQMYIMLEWSI